MKIFILTLLVCTSVLAADLQCEIRAASPQLVGPLPDMPPMTLTARPGLRFGEIDLRGPVTVSISVRPDDLAITVTSHRRTYHWGTYPLLADGQRLSFAVNTQPEHYYNLIVTCWR